MRRIVVVDVGNSATKLTWMEEGEARRRERISHEEPESAERVFDAVRRSRCPPVLVGVAPSRLEDLSTRLRPLGALRAGVDFAPLLPNRCRRPETTGQDRLFAACGALRHARPPLVVVDAGTAITVDRVSQEPAFEGGAIVPGVRLALRSLSRGAEQLPEIAPPDHPGPFPLPGRDTREAILHGVVMGAASAVEGLVRALRTRGDEPILLTGGDAELLCRHLSLAALTVTDLVAEGVWDSLAAAEGAG